MTGKRGGTPPTDGPGSRVESEPATLAVPGPTAMPRFPVVGIGASAGGLEAFGELLKHLAPDTGMAFVLVQHLDPSHPSMLTALLARTARCPFRRRRTA